jgi:hypothetical protein
MRSFVLALLALLLAAGPALADEKFHSVPKSGKGKSKLQLRVVAYNGSTNGTLTVEVKNPTGKPLTFSAEGLYFVPDGDPDKAPQRLGAVGPMQIAEGDDDRDDDGEVESVTIPAEDSVTLSLEVFCIDSHRASPSASTDFTIAKKRMPKQLVRDIDRDARKAAKSAGSYEAANDDIQGAVWKNRNKKWVELDGEGDQESRDNRVDDGDIQYRHDNGNRRIQQRKDYLEKDD